MDLKTKIAKKKTAFLKVKKKKNIIGEIKSLRGLSSRKEKKKQTSDNRISELEFPRIQCKRTD